MEWQGGLTKVTSGYGRVRVRKKNYVAHRIAYELAYGPITNDVKVLHSCDNTRCCNPKHLFLGTQAENIVDMHTKDRAKKARGERAGMAKLTEAEVIDIRKRKHEGELNRVLADEFDVSEALISHVYYGRVWRHVPGWKQRKVARYV